MNVENFLIRPKRRLVEKYSRAGAWAALSKDGIRDLAEQVAGLPTELPSEDEEVKRFDLLLLRLQLAVLHVEPAFERLRDQVKSLAALLEEKATIPMVKAQMSIVDEIREAAKAAMAGLMRQDAERQPDRIREPRGRSPDRARRTRCRPTLRVSIYRCVATRA